jgi:hypothetical protein
MGIPVESGLGQSWGLGWGSRLGEDAAVSRRASSRAQEGGDPGRMGSGWAQEARIPMGCGSSTEFGPCMAVMVGILVVGESCRACGMGVLEGWECGCLTQSWCTEGPKEQGSWQCMDLVIPHEAGAQQFLRYRGSERQGSLSCMNLGGAGTQHGPSGREQWVHRPMGQGLGRLAIFLIGCGMEKPSMI